MKSKHYNILLLGLIIIIGVSCNEERVDFNAQIRPILNKNCVSCHGGVRQNGGYDLIFEENALGKTKNDNIGIVPGNPGKSELIKRINHKDPEMRMPPESEPLKKEEIKLLTNWIKQGAQWDDHWAYINPKEIVVPKTESSWVNNEIDHFILQKIDAQGLKPSAEADKFDLVRRLYLDLTGLPPSLNQVKSFVNDTKSNAYENLVDTLLVSENYGEHWASMWLDLARYADSKGYEKDDGRQIWKYRDWVIKAFNEDKPFDEFTIEQLAGDLLTDPSFDQLIATAFHRNTLNNDEGGTNNEEYRVAAVIDRVNTTFEVFQSTTMACVQCHSHPYEPIKHEEYYKSFAFFNNTSDWDISPEIPLLKELVSEDSVKLEEVKEWISKHSDAKEGNKWEQFVLVGEPKLRAEDFDSVQNVVHRNRTGQDYMVASNGSLIKIKNVDLNNINRIYFNYRKNNLEKASLTIRSKNRSGSILGKVELEKTAGFKHLPIKINNGLKKEDLVFLFESDSDDFSCEIDGFLLGENLPGDQSKSIYSSIDNLLNAKIKHSTPIMIEKHPKHGRKTNVFDRGNFTVKGKEVSAEIPGALNKKNLKLANRLDFAKWLVGEDNPLTSRVIVNRFWEKLFGRGIVPTVEDFGTQGDYPSHPELLDWLAVHLSGEFNWSIKQLLKKIVMSATYRQSAMVTTIAKEKDPDNIWLSRSPRVRLSAEQIRDQALAVAGLLSNKMNGPSVMPYQPDGVWQVVYSGALWETSKGEDAYRRGLYTYLRRSSPYPSLITFDAAEREICLSRRIMTNTPLQALVTLNDPVYFEAARNLAQQIKNDQGSNQAKVNKAYLCVMGKNPELDKTEILVRLLEETEAYYLENREEAMEMAKTDDLELASLTVMANALMNMDEFIMKN